MVSKKLLSSPKLNQMTTKNNQDDQGVQDACDTLMTLSTPNEGNDENTLSRHLLSKENNEHSRDEGSSNDEKTDDESRKVMDSSNRNDSFGKSDLTLTSRDGETSDSTEEENSSNDSGEVRVKISVAPHPTKKKEVQDSDDDSEEDSVSGESGNESKDDGNLTTNDKSMDVDLNSKSGSCGDESVELSSIETKVRKENNEVGNVCNDKKFSKTEAGREPGEDSKETKTVERGDSVAFQTKVLTSNRYLGLIPNEYLPLTNVMDSFSKPTKNPDNFSPKAMKGIGLLLFLRSVHLRQDERDPITAVRYL